MTGIASISGWLLAASTLLLWLAPIVALIDRLTAPWWSANVRAWLWRLMLLRVLMPTVSVPGPLVVAVPALRPAEAAVADAWFVAWSVGAVLFLLSGSVASWRQRRRLLAGTVPANRRWHDSLRAVAERMGLRRLPAVRVSATGAGPCVVGIRRAVIVLPAHLLTLADSARAHLLAHELAHIVRRDALRTALFLPVLVAFWFHPAMWFLALRLRALREVAADAVAVRSTNGAFVATLAACVQAQLQPVPALRGLTMVGTVAELRERFAALRRPPCQSLRHRVLVPLFAGLLVVCCVPVAARMPSLGELPGCLQQRFLVLGALAREHAEASR
ncbi:MAG: M56 family metallopeptidase [Planctomycetes bacterium]|nr:M56 family metallopeptidase [Planctomycetota bacterium]